MEKKKIDISEMSVDELMVVAKKKLSKPIRKTKATEKHDRAEHIKDFIISENIKSHATITVPHVIVYDRYNKWAANNDYKALSLPLFSKEFTKIFNKIKRGKTVYYLLHPEGFNLSEEYHESIKKKYNIKK